MEREIEIDVLDLFNFLKKKALIIAIVTIACGILGFSFSKIFITPQYQSSSMIYITSGGSGTVVQSMLSELQAGTALTADYKTLVQSKPVLNQVIEDLNLDMTYDELNSKVSVENPENTRILTIIVDNEDPVLAKSIVDDLTAVVIEQIADIMDTTRPNILQRGDIAKDPYYPSNTKIGIKSAMLAFLLMLIVFVIMYIQKDMIITTDDIEKHLNQRCLAQIPEYTQESLSKEKNNG